jgi:L-fuconolactonase
VTLGDLDEQMCGIVDSHHHLWDPARPGSEWLQVEAMKRINRPYGLAELREVTGRNGVSATVLVQTVADLDESVERCAVAAESGGLIAGVVGWVDLTAGSAVVGPLDRLRSERGGDRLVGIRHLAQGESDREWLRRDDVVEAVAAVGRAGLVYELLVLTDQLASAVSLVSRLDDVAFVLDHAAKPPFGAGDESWSAWRSGVAELALRPNVVCKLSGLATEADWRTWDADTLRPAADHVLGVFGAGRVLFGSDWPVCELAGSYDEVLAAARDLTAGCSESERAQIFGANARRVYGI